MANSVAEPVETPERFAFGGKCKSLVRLTTAGSGHGCNEFVFVRAPLPVSTLAS